MSPSLTPSRRRRRGGRGIVVVVAAAVLGRTGEAAATIVALAACRAYRAAQCGAHVFALGFLAPHSHR